MGTFLETFTVLSAAASVTNRIVLGTGVLLLPLRDPIMTAKASASLDLLTGGRLILGVGAGIFRGEFTSLGVDYEKRWDRTEEAISVIRKLWTAEKVSHSGRYYKFENARIGPPPARGTIPILIGGAMEHVLERTARVADGWIASSHNNDAKGLKDSWMRIRGYAQKYGRDPDKLMFFHNVFTHVSSSFQESLQETRSFFQQLYGGSIPQEIKSRTILGSPEDCVNGVSERVDAGIQHIIFMFPFNSVEKLRRFGREVLPKLKKKF